MPGPDDSDGQDLAEPRGFARDNADRVSTDSAGPASFESGDLVDQDDDVDGEEHVALIAPDPAAISPRSR